MRKGEKKGSEPGEVSLRVSSRAYPLEAVRSAGYAFLDRAYIRLDVASSGDYLVRLKGKEALPDSEARRLQGEFWNELLHQSLRIQISETNRTIREHIVVRALASIQPESELPREKPDASAKGRAALPDKELEREIKRLLAKVEKGGRKEDPLGVSIPWERKYDSKKPTKKNVAAKI